MEIAFGVLSAFEPEDAVRQLVGSLGQRDPILVHHDYSKQPRFSLPASHAHVIRDYVATEWGKPELARAIFHLIRTALEHSRFDYFQLLSASCLPLRPIAELRGYLAEGNHPIYCDILNLDADERVMMSHGHRVFCRVDKAAARLLGRSRRWYLGNDPITMQQANLGIEGRANPEARLTAWQWLGKKIHDAARRGLLDDHPFRDGTAPLVGSLWFCLRRDVCEYLVRQEDSNPLIPYLMGLKVCDEILFPTILGNSSFDIMPSNHLVNDFVGPHPRLFDMGDVDALASSDRFFGRKFSPRASDGVRLSVLTRLDRLDRLQQGGEACHAAPFAESGSGVSGSGGSTSSRQSHAADVAAMPARLSPEETGERSGPLR